MNKENKRYQLKSIFEKFKDYTGYKDTYSSSGFARKIQTAFSKYKLSDYMPIIKAKDPERPAHHKQTYFFTEEEKNMVSLFMCGTAPKYGKSKKDYSEEKLNPFPWTRNGCNTKLSELRCYMEHLLDYVKDNRTELNNGRMTPLSLDSDPCYINYAELDNIDYKIKLSVRLKEELERILTVLYFQDKFNSVIFEYMLTRLEGFADELDIINCIDKEYNYLGKVAYNSADVSLAASLGDALAYSNYMKQNKSKGSKEYLNRYYRTSLISEDETNEILTPKHRPLSNIRLHQHRPKLSFNYMNYIDKTIENMVTDYIGISTQPNVSSDSRKSYYEKYGISLNAQSPTFYRLESRLFVNFILPNLEDVVPEKVDSEQVANKIKEEIHKILDAAKKDTKKFILEDEYQISSVLDILFFKPFIRFHDLDVKELARRTEDNPIY